jgi:hypothetical protein
MKDRARIPIEPGKLRSEIHRLTQLALATPDRAKKAQLEAIVEGYKDLLRRAEDADRTRD